MDKLIKLSLVVMGLVVAANANDKAIVAANANDKAIVAANANDMKIVDRQVVTINGKKREVITVEYNVPKAQLSYTETEFAPFEALANFCKKKGTQGKMIGCGIEASIVASRSDTPSFFGKNDDTVDTAAQQDMLVKLTEAGTAKRDPGIGGFVTATFTDEIVGLRIGDRAILENQLLYEARVGFGIDQYNTVKTRAGGRVHYKIDATKTFYVGSFVQAGIGGKDELVGHVTEYIPDFNTTSTNRISADLNIDYSLGLGAEIGVKEFDFLDVKHLTFGFGFEYVYENTKAHTSNYSVDDPSYTGTFESLEAINHDFVTQSVNIKVTVGYKF